MRTSLAGSCPSIVAAESGSSTQSALKFLHGDCMSDIKLIKSHSLPIAKAKALVQKAADELAAEYDLGSEWEGNMLRFHRLDVDGQVYVTDSVIRLDVTLGF